MKLNPAYRDSPSSDPTVAHYEYGPFGSLTHSSGTYSTENNFRWSTKYTDNETDLLYYGYRYYDSEMGRWLNRDPIGERGGYNLYGFVGNDGVNAWDLLGMQFFDPMDFELNIFSDLADFLRDFFNYSKDKAITCLKCTGVCTVVTLVGDVVSDEIKERIDTELKRAFDLGKTTKYSKTIIGIEKKVKVLKKIGKALTPVTKIITVKETAECTFECIDATD